MLCEWGNKAGKRSASKPQERIYNSALHVTTCGMVTMLPQHGAVFVCVIHVLALPFLFSTAPLPSLSTILTFPLPLSLSLSPTILTLRIPSRFPIAVSHHEHPTNVATANQFCLPSLLGQQSRCGGCIKQGTLLRRNSLFC